MAVAVAVAVAEAEAEAEARRGAARRGRPAGRAVRCGAARRGAVRRGAARCDVMAILPLTAINRAIKHAIKSIINGHNRIT